MSILQAVAMATNNRKDNHFFLFSTYFLPFLALVSVKYLETRQSCENDFGQYFNLKKWKILLTKCFTIFGVTFLMLRVCFKPVTWYIEMQHVRTFFFCVASWLFRITWCSYSTCLSSRRKLTVLFVCHRTVSMTAVYQLKIKYDQDKFKAVF